MPTSSNYAVEFDPNILRHCRQAMKLGWVQQVCTALPIRAPAARQWPARFASSNAGGAASATPVAPAEQARVVEKNPVQPFNPMNPDVYATLSTWTVLRSAAIFTACSQQWLVGPLVSMLRAAHGTPLGQVNRKQATAFMHLLYVRRLAGQIFACPCEKVFGSTKPRAGAVLCSLSHSFHIPHVPPTPSLPNCPRAHTQVPSDCCGPSACVSALLCRRDLGGHTEDQRRVPAGRSACDG